METVKREIGKTTITVTKDLSQRLKIASAMKGIHIYQFTEMLLEQALEKLDVPTFEAPSIRSEGLVNLMVKIPSKKEVKLNKPENLNVILSAANRKKRGRPRKNG
jgi:hypothetical protein